MGYRDMTNARVRTLLKGTDPAGTGEITWKEYCDMLHTQINQDKEEESSPSKKILDSKFGSKEGHTLVE